MFYKCESSIITMLTKILILGFSLAVAVAATEEPDWNDVLNECAIKNGLGEDLDLETAEDVENCILACTMKGVGTMTEDGVYAVEKVIKLIPKEYPEYDGISAGLRKCAQQAIGKTDCNTAGLLRDCLREELPCDDDYECGVASYIFLIYNSQMVHE